MTTKQMKVNAAIVYVFLANDDKANVWVGSKERTLQNIDTRLFIKYCGSNAVISIDSMLVALNIGSTSAERYLRLAKAEEWAKIEQDKADLQTAIDLANNSAQYYTKE